MNNKIIIFTIVLVMLASNTYAIGITPGLTTVKFEPGLQRTIEFTVVNSEKENMGLVVLVQGELNQSISLDEISFDMKANENEKKINYNLNLPNSLSPGTHSAEVVVIQIPDREKKSSAFVGAVVGVATRVDVIVPYPGKYAEASLNVYDSNAPGKMNFVLPVVSKGDLDIVRVRAVIDIYTSLNEKIGSVSTNEISLPSGKRDELIAEWTTNATPGKYKAVATLIFDEDTTTLEREFSLGNKLLELLQIDVNGFELGEIAKLELLVENKWSEIISGAYANMLIYNDKKEIMADVKSPNYDLQPLNKDLMVIFWDTGGVKKGTYDASVFLKFGSESRQQDIKLEVSDNDIQAVGLGYVIAPENGDGKSSLVVILSVAIGVLIAINVLWFMVLRKKLKGK